MKKILFGFGILALFAAQPVMAEFNVQEMQQVTGLALDDFARDNAEHVQHLTGWKIWKSGEGVKVKLYVDHDGMNMEHNYSCYKHEDSKLQCHVQE
jgi:hypothetical protein